MAGGYQVGIASETKAFKQGVESGIIEPLEDAQKELVELGRNRGPEQLERSMKDAERATDKLADETKRTADVIEKEYRDSYRKARQSADDGLDGMRRNTEEATGELKQNLGETFSSFRGDLEDIPQIAQDVFGGLAGSVGGLTASLGLAGAAGAVGLLIQGFQNLQKEEEERKERVAEWASTYISSLGQMKDAVADFAAVEAIYTDPEKYAEAEKNAKNWGVSLSTAANAMAGDSAALAIAQQNVADSTDTWRDALERADGDIRGLNHDMRTLRDESTQGQASLDKLNGEMDEGRARAENYSQSLIDLAKGASGATVEVDELGNTVYTLPDGKQIMIDAKTGKATTDLETFKGDADDVIDHVNGRDINLHVAASVRDAQNAINRFVADNDGRTFRLHGRFDVAPAGWDK